MEDLSFKVKNFSFKKIVSSVGSVLNSVHLKVKNDKISWLRTNLPKNEVPKKQQGENIPLAVGLPPAEALVGKALAYGTVDPGFAGLTSIVNEHTSTPKNRYELLPGDTSSRDLGFRGNGLSTGKAHILNSGQSHNGHLRGVSDRYSERDRSGVDSRVGESLPNTTPLTKEELTNIIPFRSYTFYSDLDVDKFSGYKTNSVLSSDSEDLAVASFSSDITNSEHTT